MTPVSAGEHAQRSPRDITLRISAPNNGVPPRRPFRRHSDQVISVSAGNGEAAIARRPSLSRSYTGASTTAEKACSASSTDSPNTAVSLARNGIAALVCTQSAASQSGASSVSPATAASQAVGETKFNRVWQRTDSMHIKRQSSKSSHQNVNELGPDGSFSKQESSGSTRSGATARSSPRDGTFLRQESASSTRSVASARSTPWDTNELRPNGNLKPLDIPDGASAKSTPRDINQVWQRQDSTSLRSRSNSISRDTSLLRAVSGSSNSGIAKRLQKLPPIEPGSSAGALSSASENEMQESASEASSCAAALRDDVRKTSGELDREFEALFAAGVESPSDWEEVNLSECPISSKKEVDLTYAALIPEQQDVEEDKCQEAKCPDQEGSQQEESYSARMLGTATRISAMIAKVRRKSVELLTPTGDIRQDIAVLESFR